MFILDEEKIAKEILNSKEKPKEMSISYLITLMAKLFAPEYKQRDDINGLICMIKLLLPEFDISTYQEYMYSEKIKDICNRVIYENETFRKVDSIPIYQDDLDIINSLDDFKYRKLMFTIIAIARYMNCEGWINKKTSKAIYEVFKLANITDGSTTRNKMLYHLKSLGYIDFARSNTNRNIRVINYVNSGNIVYEITDMSNLGEQYAVNLENKIKYKRCSICGKIIKAKSNSAKYCNSCKNNMYKQRKKEYYYREKDKLEKCLDK